jgi:hypothetical protein
MLIEVREGQMVGVLGSRRRWSPYEDVSDARRNHHGYPKEFAVTSMSLRVSPRLRRQKQVIPDMNPFGVADETDQHAGVCPILTPVGQAQVYQRSLYMCSLWRQSSCRVEQQMIRNERNKRERTWVRSTYQLLHGAWSIVRRRTKGSKGGNGD